MTVELDADVVIVGSGVAGAMTAWKLAAQGVRNILVLEAGPRIDRAAIVRGFQQSAFLDSSAGYPNPDWAPRPDWARVNDPVAHASPYIENIGPLTLQPEFLRVVGGTTWHWGGVTPRFLPVDFRLRSTYGVGVDWPVTYDLLEPYYTEAEYEIGVAGGEESSDGAPRSKPFPMPPMPLTYCDNVISGALQKEGFHFISRLV